MNSFLPNIFRNRMSLSLILLSIIVSQAVYSGSSAQNQEWFGRNRSPDSPVAVDIPVYSDNTIKIIFSIDGAYLNYNPNGRGCEVEIPGEGYIDIEGQPLLPTVSRLIAIPPQAKVSFHCEYGDILTKEGVDILPSSNIPLADVLDETDLFYDESIYEQDVFFPENIAEISRPAVIRELRLVRVSVNPLSCNPVTKTLNLYRRIEVTLNFEPGGTENILPSQNTVVSRQFAPIYESLVENYHQLELETDQNWGTLLIIAPNNPSVLNLLQPLIEWKKRKGFPTILADLSETGSTSAEIIEYITEVYNNSDPKLTYLILIGDCAGSIAVPPSNPFGDHDYTRLEGDDILADIAVGRFSCANTTQLQTEVNKVIGYESNPFMGQTAWYKKGAVVAAHPSSGFSTIQTKQAVRYKALMNDYTAVDTLWYNMAGSITTFTSNAINSGVGFYNFRGFIGMTGWSNTYTNNLTNYFKLPFVVTITCETGDITTSSSANSEEFFRAGTPNNPIGAIGAVGTATHGTHTRHNNCMDMGIFAGFFDYGIYGLGDALNNGKYYLYINYPFNPTSVEDFSEWNNLIGDPSTPLWTDIPQSMLADYPDVLPIGSTGMTVSVADSATGAPLENADVCLYSGDIQEMVTTDVNGEAFFSLLPEIEGEILVTCTIHNYKPHLGSLIIQNDAIFINYQDLEIDDDNAGLSSGNSDGNINPGETIEFGMSLKNYGQSITATNIITLLTTGNSLITLQDSVQTFPDLPPDSVSPVIQSFVFTVSEDAPHGTVIDFNLEVTCDQAEWTSVLPLTIEAPDMVFQSCTVLDSNNQLDPGEVADIIVTLFNAGGLSAESLTGELECSNEYVSIIQSIGNFGNADINQTVSDTFTVQISPFIIPGTIVDFTLNLSGNYGYEDSAGFQIQTGVKNASDPVGPDEYGYYALDDTDTMYSGCPTYDWVEIDPSVTGFQYPGTLLPLTDYGDEQDDSTPLNLPFTFTYYGLDYSVIAVCSNGWLAFGEDMVYYTNFRNWMIPCTLGPYAMVSPFWDDLYMTQNPPKKVYAYFDQPEHRLIIEWNLTNAAPGNPLEKFEVILFDPEYYPNQTGDGVILFQYEDVSNVFGVYSDNHFATVGIEDHTSQIGIQYSYWNNYPDGAAVLADGRAIKFTTDIPVHLGSLAIEDLTITLEQNDIILSWSEQEEASMYYIYRSDVPYYGTFSMTPYDSTTAIQYIDNDAGAGEKYFYRVTYER